MSDPGGEWDAVVVGAGPAGCVAACELARAGLRVLLVDKASFPRDKACGCCLNAAALRMLEQAGLADVVRRSGACSAQLLDLCIGGLRPARAVLPLEETAILRRSVLDAALAGAAEAQGAVFCAPATARLGAPLGLRRIVHVDFDGCSHEAQARVVIAADGLGGTLLRDEDIFRPRVRRASYMGAAVTLEAGASRGYEPGVIWMTSGDGGYVGAVRLEDGRLHLAAALDPALVRERGGPGPAARHMLEAGGRWAIDGIEEAHWRGTPALSRTRRVEGRDVLVIGDAAGYVEPFTGEGMAWAIMSAVAAAPIAVKMARGGECAGEWTRVHKRLIAQRQGMCRAVSWVLRRPRLARGAVRLLGVGWVDRVLARSVGAWSGAAVAGTTAPPVCGGSGARGDAAARGCSRRRVVAPGSQRRVVGPVGGVR